MGKIKVTPCQVEGKTIEGLFVIEPTVFKDERGYFMETYNQNDFKEAGLDMVFVQDNQSMSVKGVLRGLHFQKQFPAGRSAAPVHQPLGRGYGQNVRKLATRRENADPR